jgi:ubiquinone/menaquinone biosynthesis C-methylase UbiE
MGRRVISGSDKVFAGSIPDIYDAYLVPLIFEDHAADLARRVAALGPAGVLETAAGSGVVTRAVAPALAPEARYVVTDLNQPMLDRAARMQGADERITWAQADALNLPFADGRFDAVLCQFGVMFFPDRVRGYREARRVQRPGGRFLFNVWDGIGDNEFADEVTRAVGGLFPEDPPLFLARTPHGHGDCAVIRAELEAAGFRDIRIETVTGESRAPSARHPAVAYYQGTPLRNEIEARDAGRLEQATEHAARAIARRWGEGPVAAKIQGHVIEAAA